MLEKIRKSKDETDNALPMIAVETMIWCFVFDSLAWSDMASPPSSSSSTLAIIEVEESWAKRIDKIWREHCAKCVDCNCWWNHDSLQRDTVWLFGRSHLVIRSWSCDVGAGVLRNIFTNRYACIILMHTKYGVTFYFMLFGVFYTQISSRQTALPRSNLDTARKDRHFTIQ